MIHVSRSSRSHRSTPGKNRQDAHVRSFDLVAFDVISSWQIFLISSAGRNNNTIEIFALKDDNFEVSLTCDSCF